MLTISWCALPFCASSRMRWLANRRRWSDCQPSLSRQLSWAQPLCLASRGPWGPHHHCEWHFQRWNSALKWILNLAIYITGHDPFICQCFVLHMFAELGISVLTLLFCFMQLTFSYFHVEEHSTCRWDSVTIFNGGSPGSPIIGQYCGENSPGTVRSGSNKLAIVFLADSSVSHGGFIATWSTDSSGTTQFYIN